MGVMFPDIMEVFNTTRAAAAAVQSTTFSVGSSGGIFYGALVARVGPRAVCMAGTVLILTGMLFSYFATSLPYLIISYGAVPGLGYGIYLMSASTVVGQTIDKRHTAVALSILSTSLGVGAMSYNYILVSLLDKFGLRGTMLILAAIVFHGIPLAFVWPSLQTMSMQRKPDADTDGATASIKKETSPDIIAAEQRHASQENRFGRTRGGNDIAALSFNEADVIKSSLSKDGMTRRLTVHDLVQIKHVKPRLGSIHISDLSLNVLQRMKIVSRNINVILFTIGFSLVIPLLQVILIVTVDLVKDKGFPEDIGASALMVVNICSIVGRVATGFILKLPKLTALSVPIIASLLATIAFLTLAFASALPALFVAFALVGVAFGQGITSGMVTAVKLMGRELLPETLGIVHTTTGLINVAVGPLVGYIRDQTGTYTSFLLGGAAITLLGATIFGVHQYLRTRHRRKHQSRKISVFYITTL